jgi:hypothetical protein
LARGISGGWWTGGGMLLAGLFLAGGLHRFRRPEARLGWWLAAAGLPLLLVAHGMTATGVAGERDPLVYGAPLLLLGGAGFLQVLLSSAPRWTQRTTMVGLVVVTLQAVPLGATWFGANRLHFAYPPYYPDAIRGVAAEVQRRSAREAAWMCDQPQGAAWYAGQRVWAQPTRLRDFYAIYAEQPLVALLLTPATLDRPFFDDLAKGDDGATASRFGDWDQIYRGLVTGEWPREFPLRRRQAIAPNHQILLDDRRVPLR